MILPKLLEIKVFYNEIDNNMNEKLNKGGVHVLITV